MANQQDEKLDVVQLNAALEAKLKAKRIEWKDKVIAVIKKIKSIDLDRTEHVNLHMEMLILREDLIFEIAGYKSKMSSIKAIHRKHKKDQYFNLTTNFDIKLGSYSDKEIFISANLTELMKQIDIFQNFIDFLQEQVYTCDKLGFSIKHVVESRGI